MGQKLTIDQTAAELGISKRGVRRLIASGALRAYRIGAASVRIDITDLDAVCKPIQPQALDAPLKAPTPLPKRRKASR